MMWWDEVVVWAYAEDHGFVIASKDSDFRQLSFTFGHPLKVIWIRANRVLIRRGYCSTSDD